MEVLLGVNVAVPVGVDVVVPVAVPVLVGRKLAIGLKVCVMP